MTFVASLTISITVNNVENVMKKLNVMDTLAHMASLDSTYCDLWHPEDLQPKATDFIIQEFQHPDGDSFTLSIPVCSTCVGYLSSGQLSLVYCYGCGHSQWKLNKSLLVKNNINWQARCAECVDKEKV